MPAMSAVVRAYLKKITVAAASGDATEHSYRPALQELLQSLVDGIEAVNEPRRHVACGAPDFVVKKSAVPVGYVECKDIGKNLDRVEESEQLVGYLTQLPNLLLTDYLSFRWYRNGALCMKARLARARSGPASALAVKAEKAGAAEVQKLLHGFLAAETLTVATAAELAKYMARLAIIMRSRIARILHDTADESETKSNLGQLFASYREVLIRKLSIEDFADMQAQTAAYGLFAARCRHRGPDFTRQNAAFIETNPFLHDVFLRVAGPNMDPRITWIAEALVALLARADMYSVLQDFGGGEREEDPVIHFYEDFLKAYNPYLRERRGVYYTPTAAVSFIVRAVDFLLREKFGIAHGLAETDTGENRHSRVLILDPAAGTGTFLCEVIALAHQSMIARGLAGAWPEYAREHLLPRLFGFELLMAPYAICHLKLEMKLAETGAAVESAGDKRRLQIYLTNTLEKAEETASGPIFAHEIVREAMEASSVKREKPVMVVIGNPPYSGHSANTGEWIKALLHGRDEGKITADYFSVDGRPLGERNPKWLNDDYVKFIRFAQWRIERTGEGVVGFIANNAWIDNPTFRGMRESLLFDFDEIYILDLHGNSKKKERAPDGGKDDNVFDIQQGVAIILLVKKPGGDKKPAQVFHADLWGERGGKERYLRDNGLATTEWTELAPGAPSYFFVPRDNSLAEEYEAFWSVPKIFPVNSLGIVTSRDKLTIHWTKKQLAKTVKEFSSLPIEDARQHFRLGEDARDWKVSLAQEDLRKHTGESHIKSILYRPFDERFTWYSGKTRGFHCMPRQAVMRHMLAGENIGLCTIRSQEISGVWSHVLASRNLIQNHTVSMKENNYLFPLYLYPEAISKKGREENLAPDFVAAAHRALGKKPQAEEMFHYIYAILHSPEYRRRYRDFLKSDFPRIPLATDRRLFRRLAAVGKTLVTLHLMRTDGAAKDKPGFPVAKGGGAIAKIRRQAQKTYINETQYFAPISEQTWNHPIGGYRPAQKWLQDRKGQTLDFSQIESYRSLCAILAATGRLMEKADTVINACGGWDGIGMEK